jgi:DNA-binding GntR family transcriptional regulator
MTTNQQLILAALEANLARATTPAMRQHVQEQITTFKAHCAPKPKPTHPAWVDNF